MPNLRLDDLRNKSMEFRGLNSTDLSKALSRCDCYNALYVKPFVYKRGENKKFQQERR